MKYFIDTEFIEGKQDKTFLGVKYGETKPTIDLISIGIVSEATDDFNNYCNKCDKQVGLEGTKCNCEESIKTGYTVTYSKGGMIANAISREYYAISKDFNLKQAWKNEWVRDNVLLSIYNYLRYTDYLDINMKRIESHNIEARHDYKDAILKEIDYSWFKYLLNKYGKTNKQIAKEIIEFVYTSEGASQTINGVLDKPLLCVDVAKVNPEFYGYYSDYDWVVFAQLFGTMMDLPVGFPMYCIDLKQTLDEKALMYDDDQYSNLDIEGKVEYVKTNSKYPKQTNEHNALADAKWNYELYKFLNTL
ncbi:3'-5' exoribonuclease [Dolichospermum sp. ST_sed10]|nr:3'-5' exoribonuclease [Dolichospermum sp. ST_sed10]